MKHSYSSSVIVDAICGKTLYGNLEHKVTVLARDGNRSDTDNIKYVGYIYQILKYITYLK